MIFFNQNRYKLKDDKIFLSRSSSTAVNTTPNSHMKIYYCLIFSFLYVLFFGGCESPKNLSTDYPSLEFKVDPNLLGTKIKDSELRMDFSPPIGWKPAVSTSFLNDNHTDYSHLKLLIGKPKFFFQHESSNSLCIVSNFVNIFDQTMDKYLSTLIKDLKEKFPDASIQKITFFKEDLLTNQIRILTSKHVIFKLVFQPSEFNPFELIYILPKNEYELQSRSIESSIGSTQVF